MSDTTESQARAQVESIVSMVAALSVDYARLQELREEFEAFEGEEKAAAEIGKAEWPSDVTTHVDNDLIEAYDTGRELAELENAAGENESEDDAREAIQNDALSVEVRCGWTNPCAISEVGFEEFRIVLCTGGPHVEIVGDLDRGTPTRARILYGDGWGDSGEYFPESEARDAVLTYCQQFYFGD